MEKDTPPSAAALLLSQNQPGRVGTGDLHVGIGPIDLQPHRFLHFGTNYVEEVLVCSQSANQKDALDK